MKRYLTDEQREQVVENMGLALWFANKWNYKLPRTEFNEILSLCHLGMVKAAYYYKPEKSKFATFACRCMENEILMSLRAIRKNAPAVSIYERIAEDPDGNIMEIIDFLRDPEAEHYLREDMKEEWVKEILNRLGPRERRVMEMIYYENMTQLEVAKEMNLSQSYISRLRNRAVRSVRRKYGKEGDGVLNELFG